MDCLDDVLVGLWGYRIDEHLMLLLFTNLDTGYERTMSEVRIGTERPGSALSTQPCGLLVYDILSQSTATAIAASYHGGSHLLAGKVLRGAAVIEMHHLDLAPSFTCLCSHLSHYCRRPNLHETPGQTGNQHTCWN
jgi:hypothetical protein